MDSYIENLRKEGVTKTISDEIKDQICNHLNNLNIPYECSLNHYMQFQISLYDKLDKEKL